VPNNPCEEKEERRGIFHNISRNWRELKGKVYLTLSVFLIILVVIGAYFFNSIFINVYPGEAGVLWKRFGGGTEMNFLYNEGIQVIFPWDKMYKYDLIVQQTAFEFEALSKDGLPIKFLLSVRFFPEKSQLPKLHKEIGPDYIIKVVKPEVQAHVRKVVANYLPEQIYTSEGYLLDIIMQGAAIAFSQRYLNLDNLLIKKMTLPDSVRAAIEKKLTQEQLVLEYQYRLMRESKEAQRKAIEAEGIRRFQEIVKAGGFFDKYLQYKGIEATLELAKSNNAKVVVVGGEGKLPLIMNMDSSGINQPVSEGEAVPAKKPEVEFSEDAPESSSAFLERLKGYFKSSGGDQAVSEPTSSDLPVSKPVSPDMSSSTPTSSDGK